MSDLAFMVQEDFEGTGGIIFAKSNLEARKVGADLWNDSELGGMTVKRRKDLDRFKSKGVPAWLLVSEGWRYECSGCGMEVSEWRFEEEGMNITGIVGTDAGHVYCSHMCRMTDLATTAHNKALGSAFCDMLKDMVRNRFPGFDHYFGEYQPYSHVREGVVQAAAVGFQFPGMKHGPAKLRYDHSGPRGETLIGPVRPQYECCAGDRETFEALATRDT